MDNVSPVRQLMRDLGAGKATMDQAVHRLSSGLLKPTTIYEDEESWTVMDWERNDIDGVAVSQPETWNDVSYAWLVDDVISLEQYQELRSRVVAPRPIRLPTRPRSDRSGKGCAGGPPRGGRLA